MTKTISARALLPDEVDLTITRDMISVLLLESHKKSANAAEEIMAIKELAKLHNMYEVKPTTVVNMVNIEQHVKKLEVMTDDELLQLAGNHPHLFEKPDAVVVGIGKDRDDETIDADFEEVE